MGEMAPTPPYLQPLLAFHIVYIWGGDSRTPLTVRFSVNCGRALLTARVTRLE